MRSSASLIAAKEWGGSSSIMSGGVAVRSSASLIPAQEGGGQQHHERGVGGAQLRFTDRCTGGG